MYFTEHQIEFSVYMVSLQGELGDECGNHFQVRKYGYLFSIQSFLASAGITCETGAINKMAAEIITHFFASYFLQDQSNAGKIV